MTHDIIVKFQKEGFHNWPQARELLPEAAFLSDRHRHMFHFSVYKKVEHDDRDVEIILFKREIEGWLEEEYGSPMELGSTSCEQLGSKILRRFECSAVEVLEDGENGALTSNV